MKKSYILIFALLALIGAGMITSCKSGGLLTAEEEFNRRQFSEAARLYRKAYSKAPKEQKASVAYKIAQSYRYSDDYRAAERWYEKAIEMGMTEPQVKLDYAHILLMNEKYDEALVQFETYKKEMPSDERIDDQIAIIKEYKEQSEGDCKLWSVENFRLANSSGSDYSPVLHPKDGMIFTSDRDEATGKAEFGWTGRKYSDLFILNKVKRGRVEKWEKVNVLEGDVNSKENEGTASFDERGNTMLYTECNGPRQDSAKKKAPNCIIREGKRKGKEWTRGDVLPFCNDTTLFYGHPSLSPDGDKLVFVSDNPSGLGGHDIWLSTFVRRGRTWGDPVNLGPMINTDGDELYPYFYNDTTLYFSSNGHPGLGGLDLFVSYGRGETWTKPKHLRAPLNSGGDDFGIFYENDTSGYMSSNRTGSRSDDIYQFTRPKQYFRLLVTVRNCKGNVAVKDATVTLVNNMDDKKVTAKTNSKGEVKFDLKPNVEYGIVASKIGFINSNDNKPKPVSTMGFECSTNLAEDLEICPPVIIDVEGILYGLDSASLRPRSREILDSIYDNLLLVYPTTVLELGSHTDCRASYHHNDSLSQARADSVIVYFLAKGVDKDRLVAKGYGEHELKNNCACEPNNEGPGARCSEAEHQLNRRTTIKILRWDHKPKVKDEGGGE